MCRHIEHRGVCVCVCRCAFTFFNWRNSKAHMISWWRAWYQISWMVDYLEVRINQRGLLRFQCLQAFRAVLTGLVGRMSRFKIFLSVIVLRIDQDDGCVEQKWQTISYKLEIFQDATNCNITSLIFGSPFLPLHSFRDVLFLLWLRRECWYLDSVPFLQTLSGNSFCRLYSSSWR